MSKADKKDDGPKKRKHKKIEKRGAASQFSVIPPAGFDAIRPTQLTGAGLDIANRPNEIASQSLEYPSALRSFEDTHKSLLELVQCPTNGNITSVASLGATATSDFQDMINKPVTAGAFAQTSVHSILAENHMDAIKVDMPQALGTSSLALQDSQLFTAVGGSVINGLPVFGGESFIDLEEEQRKAELSALEKKIEEKYEQRDQARMEAIKELQGKADKLIAQAEEDKLARETLLMYIEEQKKSTASIKKTNRGDRLGIVTFDRQTGRIYIKNKFAGQLEPNILDYLLFKTLFDASGETVPYGEITKQLGRAATGNLASNYCQQIKSTIKNYAPDIAGLIKDFGTPDRGRGYKLICFGPQENVRRVTRKN